MNLISSSLTNHSLPLQMPGSGADHILILPHLAQNHSSLSRALYHGMEVHCGGNCSTPTA